MLKVTVGNSSSDEEVIELRIKAIQKIKSQIWNNFFYNKLWWDIKLEIKKLDIIALKLLFDAFALGQVW